MPCPVRSRQENSQIFGSHPRSVSVKATERMGGKGQKYSILLNLIAIELLYLSDMSIGQYVKKWKILICVVHWGTRNGPHFHTESHTACELNYKDF